MKIILQPMTAMALMLSITMAYADEGLVSKSLQEKNLCVLYSENCPKRPDNYQDTIQETLKKLRDEIAKGKAVYTTEELRILQNKLAFEETAWDYVN